MANIGGLPPASFGPPDWTARENIVLPVFGVVSPRARARTAVLLVATFALLFPLLHRNDADIEFGRERARLCRVGARTKHRRRLCRIARSRLRRVFRDRRLRLRNCQLISVATGVEQPLGAVPLARPRRPDARDRRRRRPFPGLVLVDAADFRRDRRLFRRAVRRPDLAAQGRLLGDRDPGLWRDRTDRGAQYAAASRMAPWA